MVKGRLTKLNYNEILLYLGYKGQELNEELKSQISDCIDRVLDVSEAKIVYRRLAVVNGCPEGFVTNSKDINNLLSDCDEAILMAATLGPKLEKELMKYEVTDMASAVIMDACASTAIENVCDNLENDLRAEIEAEGKFLTDRFSPGYGDLPINTQQVVSDILNTSRMIGLTVTKNSILVPRKSVTAIMGISNVPKEKRKRGCEVCNMFMTCVYRKEGATCNG